MSHYRRPFISGACIFFTVNLARRGSSGLTTHIGLLRQAFAATRAERPFTINACVVLPDHLHCIWTLPEGDSDYPTRWRLIKTRFSRELPKGPLRASHIRRNERGIWQRRYWEHHIRDDADYAAHLQYCWFDPVKHGFVDDPTDWPYSSIHKVVREGMYPAGACHARMHPPTPIPNNPSGAGAHAPDIRTMRAHTHHMPHAPHATRARTRPTCRSGRA
ncbi:REP-associated tyrosine transposase [Yoonia sp.]|uniref:REP-associated tyrosine transposase n=1 Tax=Yoonia sp. TaxID=2212373 RepID=UPI00391AA666